MDGLKNVSTLILTPGPSLVAKPTVKGMTALSPQQLTGSADQLLDVLVELDGRTRVRDVLLLLNCCPGLLDRYASENAVELAAYAGYASVPPRSLTDPRQRIDAVEIRWTYHKVSRTGAIRRTRLPEVWGRGVKQKHDYEMDGRVYRAGTSIRWSLALTPVSEILSLPLEFRDHAEVMEEGLGAQNYGDVIDVLDRQQLRLGELIQGLLTELSYHGSQDEVLSVREFVFQRWHEVRQRADQPQAGPVRLQPTEAALQNAFASVVMDSDRYDPVVLKAALSIMADSEPALIGLRTMVGDDLRLHPHLELMDGYQLRQHFWLAFADEVGRKS